MKFGAAATDADGAVLTVLKWAVSPEPITPELEVVDEDALFELASYHRILQPLLSRLDAARPAWCPTRLRTRLRIAQHEVRCQVQEKMAAAREITEAMRARGLTPPIFVKGFAAYALTADPENLHFSGDLDPFAEDLPVFWDVLHEIGYTGKRKDTHEWAKLTRGGITLDVHQYYPVLTYPAAVRRATREELEGRCHPVRWHLRTPATDLVPSGEHIRWTDLATHAAPGVAEGTTGLLFPSPTLLCLVHCAHCFRSSVTRLHYMNPLGGFRLYELKSIYDLSRLPTFNAEQFHILVEHFSAYDAALFINALMEAMLGSAMLPDPRLVDSPEAQPVFPEHLIYGGWVSLQNVEDFLRIRTIELMFEQLEAETVPAHATFDLGGAARLLTYGDREPPLPQLAIDWEELSKTVAVVWAFTEIVEDLAVMELLIHFGSDSYARATVDSAGQITGIVQKSDYLRPQQTAHAERVDGGTGWTIRMRCPVPAIPTRSVPGAALTLPLLLAARRLTPDGEGTASAWYLPLILER